MFTRPGFSDFFQQCSLFEMKIDFENLFLILLKEGDRESPAPPLMPQESETERNGFIITSYFVDFQITIDKILKFRIHCQRSLFEAHVEKSRHAGRGGGHGGAADDCSSDVAAGRRRMALETVTRASLKIVHLWASANSSGTKYFWIRVIGGQKC